jgi:DNA-binding IclR family transcriptional regulator
LEETRERGYAVDDEECHLGIACIAVAIPGNTTEPIGAISVSSVKPALLGVGFDVVGEGVRAAASRIAALLAPSHYAAAPPGSDDSERVMEA